MEKQIPQLQGLTESQVRKNRQEHGVNELPSSKEKSIWQIAWQVFKEPMFLLLITCASLYLILGNVKEGLILMSQVLVVIGITFYQERKTEKALSAIKDLSSPRALVIRDGKSQRIAGSEVVVGDIIELHEGDRVPADAKILQNTNLSIDESLLTGESAAVRKTIWEKEVAQKVGGNNMPFAYSGTMIVQGVGLAEVYAVGVQTEIGKIGKSLETVVEEKTLLQAEINRLVKIFGIVGVVLFTVSIITFGLLRGEWLQGLLAALAVAMAMVPEEFPVVLTVFMALGAWRMSRKNILARRVATIETLGSATVLCTDKTGTITQNKMQVEQLFAKDKTWDFGIEKDKELAEDFHELIEFGILAGQTEPFDPMEKAILAVATTHLAKTEHIHPKWELEKEYPLSKDLFAMSRVFKQPNTNKYAIAAKGAPEAMLELCHIDAAAQKKLLADVATFAQNGLRVLGVARATFEKTNLPEDQHDYTFTFLGFIGMSDPIREEVPKAIQECYTAGIRVIMITGDYAETAKHIAQKIGLKNPDKVISGEEIAGMNDAQLNEIMKEANVFSRVIPEQKLRLVNALKADGEIVAMTGDGVNDAPALKAAHIGIAMGGKGTDVARETASLVLLDDNFASIVTAVKMGRRIFDNLQKAMMYIFAIHIPIIAMSLIPMFTSFLPLMLLPIHIAFMELIIDPACSIVFEAESTEDDVMNRPPRHINERFFSFHKIKLGVFQGLGLAIATFAMYGLGLYKHYDEGTIRGMTFTTLLIGNLCLILTNRSRHLTIFETFFLPNPTVKWLIIGVLGLNAAVIYIPVIADLFKITHLSIAHVAMAVGAGIINIVWFEVFKKLHTADIKPA